MSESMINVFQPFVGQEERQIIGEVLETNWLGKGRFVNEFKTEFAKHLNIEPRRLASTTCGTEAIFLAADLFEFNSNDEIIVPSISFVAVGSSIIAKQAQLVLCDVDRRTLNVTAACLEQKVTKKTKAVILTHYGGVPCEMDPILDLCKTHQIKVIEDSACAMKALYKGRACGTLGDMGIWSFEAGKIITTGDGGMVYLKSDHLVKDAEEYLYLGLGSNEKGGIDRSTAGNDNWWEIQIERPGRRAIMNNLAGAIGLAQLKKIDRFIARRKEIDQRYRQNAMILWAGPRNHLVQYPLRGGKLFNLVAVFHSDKYVEGWDRQGDPDELHRRFANNCETVRSLLAKVETWRMWVLCDREPVARWYEGIAAILPRPGAT